MLLNWHLEGRFSDTNQIHFLSNSVNTSSQSTSCLSCVLWKETLFVHNPGSVNGNKQSDSQWCTQHVHVCVRGIENFAGFLFVGLFFVYSFIICLQFSQTCSGNCWFQERSWIVVLSSLEMKWPCGTWQWKFTVYCWVVCNFLLLAVWNVMLKSGPVSVEQSLNMIM